LNLDKRATMSARNTAVLAFEALDEDEQGYLTSDDIRSILLEWNTPPDFVEKLVEHIGHDDKLTFDDFYKYLWTISSFRQRLRTNVKLHEMPEDASDEQKARFVFDEIDLDSNGYIDVFELRMVVDAWGMPNSEAENYIKRFGDAQGRISFEVFHSELAPIWKFGYSVQHFRHGMRHPHHQH